MRCPPLARACVLLNLSCSSCLRVLRRSLGKPHPGPACIARAGTPKHSMRGTTPPQWLQRPKHASACTHTASPALQRSFVTSGQRLHTDGNPHEDGVPCTATVHASLFTFMWAGPAERPGQALWSCLYAHVCIPSCAACRSRSMMDAQLKKKSVPSSTGPRPSRWPASGGQLLAGQYVAWSSSRNHLEGGLGGWVGCR